ncbi:MAG TPA: hypothetical protein VKG38_15395, partial [Solirubrobacteraceae bacterium]|nr:hypothetical protein [Solirubrobacteraceae bacterium]
MRRAGYLAALAGEVPPHAARGLRPPRRLFAREHASSEHANIDGPRTTPEPIDPFVGQALPEPVPAPSPGRKSPAPGDGRRRNTWRGTTRATPDHAGARSLRDSPIPVSSTGRAHGKGNPPASRAVLDEERLEPSSLAKTAGPPAGRRPADRDDHVAGAPERRRSTGDSREHSRLDPAPVATASRPAPAAGESTLRRDDPPAAPTGKPRPA